MSPEVILSRSCLSLPFKTDVSKAQSLRETHLYVLKLYNIHILSNRSRTFLVTDTKSHI